MGAAANASIRADYMRRLHRVLETIDQQLEQPLDLDYLSSVAHFSPFHFHRLFVAWTGETLGSYLRRRRVEVAAMRLASQPALSVLNVALSVGFGSGEAFSRAFKLRFGCSPTQWRAQNSSGRQKRNPGQAPGNPDQEVLAMGLQTEGLFNTELEPTVHVTLVDRQPTPIAYLRHTGPYGEPLLHFWQEIYYPWALANNLLGQERFGLCHDDPSITAPQNCRYDACVALPEGLEPTGSAIKTTLPGGKYACLHFQGTAAGMAQGWTSLLRDWLPQSGLQLDGRPNFEYYPKTSTYDPVTGVMDCELCIPVTRL